jgi:hypothetical protein
MSGDDDRADNFLRRWSRRKQAAAARARDGDPQPESAKADECAPAASPVEPKAELPAFDPATLPPIESITAASDIRAFLAPGVPVELSRAALRRTWRTDPAIRDFIGIAENQWDFTQPDGVPGFGSLELTPELRRILARLVGDAPAVADSDAAATPVRQRTAAGVETPEAAKELPRNDDAARSVDAVQPQPLPHDDVALQTEHSEADGSERSVRRKHGSALPKL